MSLFGALSELVGGAILASAPACDLALSDAKIEDRAGFAAWIATRDEMREFRTIVEAIGREIWVGAETRGLAQLDLDQHIRAAAIIVADNRPPAALLAEIAAVARKTAPPPLGGDTPARRIGNDIVSRARASGAFSGGFRSTATGMPLREEVVLFLLERTFVHILENGRLIRLGPALSDFAAEGLNSAAAVVDPANAGLASLGISRAFALEIDLVGGTRFLGDLGERFGLSDRAMRRLVALVDSRTQDTDARIARLEQLAQWLGDVRSQLTRPSNDENEVRRLKAQAAAALAEGDFEAAMDALRNVRRELREVRRRTEERLQDEAVALRAQMHEEAKATARLAELLQARGEHCQAADLFAEAATALPRADRDAAWRYGLQRATALLDHARERDDAAALAEALSSFANLVRSAAESTNTKALAEACLGHGDALFIAGDRDPGSGRLKDAVLIYQKAIQLFERDKDLSNLRRTRLALAKALARDGERDGKIETLEQAAQAYRDAAAAIAIDKLPAEHATAQMGLGSVLLAIEERQGGIPLLTEASDAYRTAIRSIDREADGERWGEAQMNLGLALLGLGEQEGSQSQLEGSIAAFREALDVTPRIKAPRRWALTQMNLGNALAALGDRDRTGTALLDEAIVAYNQALDELIREAEPLKWAITQMNLGTALIRLGERRDRRKHWLAATSALVPALEVFEEQGADALADMTRRNLKRFQESWDSFLAPPGSAQSLPPPPEVTAKRPRLAQAG
ncbi:MAG: hypothetical protein JSS20_02995 [Proteobacteria bacterium]|nr:hypothetical protein [Pseudomonadota bacterium]